MPAIKLGSRVPNPACCTAHWPCPGDGSQGNRDPRPGLNPARQVARHGSRPAGPVSQAPHRIQAQNSASGRAPVPPGLTRGSPK